MRPYHMSGNAGRSCGRSPVSSAPNAESMPCMECISPSGNPSCDSDHVLAMAYVPWQQFRNLYDLDRALQVGTIFAELDKPFTGRGGMYRENCM